MIDIHAHLLPGVDDGPDSLEESVAICRAAAADGCDVLFATPHQRHWLWSNTDRGELEALRGQLEARLGDTPTILPGGEIRVDDELLDDLPELASSGALALGSSRYLLIEFSRDGYGPSPEDVVHELVVADWRPIVAHPEFVPSLAENVRLAARVRELGGSLQITAASLIGRFGAAARRSVERLLDADLVDFVASDCHNLGYRPPGLAEAYRTLEARWGESTARRLTEGNQRAILEDRPLAR